MPAELVEWAWPPAFRRLAFAAAMLFRGLALDGSEFIAALDSTNITHTKTASDAEYLCGQYWRRCAPVAKIPPNGPDLWMLSKFTYNRDNTYVYEEHGFMNISSCEEGDPWLILRYEGNWEGDGLSPYRRDQSVASIEITSVWLRLLYETVCVINHHDRSTNCLNTLAALRVLCPCNGWDWSIVEGQESRERNIGMFCRPLEQCPLIHQVFLQKTQYISYSATRERACFSQASSEVAVGWENPQDDEPACLVKREAMACTLVRAAAVHAMGSGWWRCTALLVLLASLLPVGIPEA